MSHSFKLFSIAFSLISLAAIRVVADNCQGTLSYQADSYVFGSCHSGFCNGWVGETPVHLEGKCQDGVTFNADDYTDAASAHGSCTGGSTMFDTFLGSSFTQVTCSNGKKFSVVLDGGYLNVPISCTLNSGFSDFIRFLDTTVTGNCE